MPNSSKVEPNVTTLERRMHRVLDSNGVSYIVHPRLKVEMFGKRRRLEPDIFVPAENLVIEVNGCYVHGCEECGSHGDEFKRFKDAARIDALHRAGYEVEVVWEHELADLEAASV